MGSSAPEERLRKALDGLVYLPALRGVESGGGSGSQGQQQPSTPSPGPTPGKPARCRPWDREDLLRRLHTFRAGTWFCKPSSLGPVACASRGWTNVALDTLKCEFCSARLFCELPPASQDGQYKQLVERHVCRLDEAHTPLCPWRGNACSEWLLQFPTLDAKVLLQQYEDRFKALAMVDFLPDVKQSAVVLMSGSRKAAVEKILGGVGPSLVGRSKAQRRAVVQQLLAACGWEVQAQSYSVSTTKAASPSSGKPQLSPGSPANAAAGVRVLRQPSPLGAPAAASQPQKKLLDSQQVVLKCPMCAARVGLWNYAPAGDSARPLWQTNLLLTAGGARSPGRHSPSLLHTPSGRSPSLQCPSPAPSADVRSSLGKTLAGGDLDTLADTSSATPKQQQLSAWGGSAAARAVKLVSSTPAKPVFGASARSESPPVFGLGAFGKGKVEAEAQKQKEMQEGGEEASQGFERQEAGKEDGEEGGGDPAAKRQRMEEAQVGNREDSRGEDADRLDPIALHRSFCPWVNTGGQAGGVRLKCGWMHVLDALPRGGAAAADSTEADEDHAPHRLAVQDYTNRFLSALYGS